MLGAEAADTVRAATKRRTKSWNKEAILTGVASIVEKKHMEKGRGEKERERERERDRFDNPKRRELSRENDNDYYYGFPELLQTRTDGRNRDPYHVPYSMSRVSLLASPPYFCTQCPRCAMSPHPNTNKGAQDSILVLNRHPKPKRRNFF